MSRLNLRVSHMGFVVYNVVVKVFLSMNFSFPLWITVSPKIQIHLSTRPVQWTSLRHWSHSSKPKQYADQHYLSVRLALLAQHSTVHRRKVVLGQYTPDSHCTYNATLRRVSLTIAAMEKQLSITYSECTSVALVIQHAKRMRRIILSSVTCLALQNFHRFSHKRQDFR